MSYSSHNPIDYRTPEPKRPRWYVPSRLQGRVLLLGLAGLGVGFVCMVVSYLSWYLTLQQNLRLASQHAATLKSMVAGDSRFADVQFSQFTARQGMLLITGGVRSQADLDFLHRKVDHLKPPVHVGWRVDVLPVAATTRLSR